MERAAATTDINLPHPHTSGRFSLEETLARRRSIRTFRPRELTTEEIGQLLWAAQGTTGRSGERTAPSAGALHPLEVYVALPSGLFRYLSAHHRLEAVGGGDLRDPLARAALDQEAIGMAPAVVVINAVYERTLRVYEARGRRYVALEAGHVAQNILLEAVALDLAAVTVGAFNDALVQRILGLPEDWHPLYLIPVGEPVY